MSFNIPGDRAVVPNRSGNEEDPDEKIKVVCENGLTTRVKYEDGQEKDIPSSDLLVDQDHQTCLDVEEHGRDHLVSVTFAPNAGIDPSVKDMSGLRQIVKMRLDVVALIFQAVSMYPNTGAAIGVLIDNIPKKK